MLTREVWNVALVPHREPFKVDEGEALVVFSAKRLRLPTRKPIHTYADPFLAVRDGQLYVFVEVQEVGRPGRIEAFVTRDLERFDPVGPVFEPPFHVSYPQVFEEGEDMFMMPETSAARELALYRFDSFPHGLSKVATLLEGRYHDATLLHDRARWWIFATTDRGLELYHSAKLTGPYKPHKCNPVQTDPAIYRCGGPFLRDNDGRIMRTAQDGSEGYGGNLHLMGIQVLDEHDYAEEFVVRDLFGCEQDWNRRGGHHLSTATFLGQNVAAIDGKQSDFLCNRLLSLLWRMRPDGLPRRTDIAKQPGG